MYVLYQSIKSFYKKMKTDHLELNDHTESTNMTLYTFSDVFRNGTNSLQFGIGKMIA